MELELKLVMVLVWVLYYMGVKGRYEGKGVNNKQILLLVLIFKNKKRTGLELELKLVLVLVWVLYYMGVKGR